jgi:hypothetical protein
MPGKSQREDTMENSIAQQSYRGAFKKLDLSSAVGDGETAMDNHKDEINII